MTYNKKLSALSVLLCGLGAFLALMDSSLAADINSVFQDIGTKTDTIRDGIVKTIVIGVCAISLIATFIGIMMHKMSWERLILIIFCTVGISYAVPFVAAIVTGN